MKITSLFVIFLMLAVNICPDETDYSVTIFFNNDSFINTDRSYTAGMAISVLLPASRTLRNFFPLTLIPFNKSGNYHFSMALSYSKLIFTPDNITLIDLVPKNRPYAGYNNISLTLMGYDEKDFESFEAGIGIIGPLSGTEYIQKSIHKLTGSKAPMGWHNQLRDEYIVQLFYDRIKKNGYIKISNMTGIELLSRMSGGLGNGLIYWGVGSSVRAGWKIPDDFGIPADRLCGLNNQMLIKNNGSGIYGFFSIDINFNLRNIFLDGNTFHKSHSVDKFMITADLNSGLVIRFNNFHILLKYTKWSKRYPTELFPHSYIKLGASFFY